MKPKYLVIMDVSQKQRYIFGSNRLRENIGASLVIARMTNVVPKEAYEWYSKKKDWEERVLDKELVTKLSSKEGIADYIEERKEYDGGGKSVYSFATEWEAKLFIEIVSTYALQTYYGIELFFALQEITTDNKLVDIQNLYKKLENKKAFRRQSFRLYGVGLNEKCPSTALPVHIVREDMGLADNVVKAAKMYEGWLEDGINQGNGKVDTYGKGGFNLEVYTKLAVLNEESDSDASEKEKSFHRFLSTSDTTSDTTDFMFPLDLENLGGTKEEKNKIAIIAIDGNGMGKRIQSIQELIERNPKMDYLDCLKIFSTYITQVYNKSVKIAIEKVEICWEELEESLDLKRNQDGKKYLPVRPLIAAGDDLCFITEGRIGLSFAKLLLQIINETSKEVLKGIREKNPWITDVVTPEEGMFASAGVVICGVKYPFSRAYDLAEELLKAGKTRLAREKRIKGSDASMIDFHVAMGEMEDSLAAERGNRDIGKVKTQKPFLLSQEGLEFSFSKFEAAMELLNKLMQDSDKKASDEEVSEKTGKSQIKEFAYYIRKGEDYATNYVNQSNRLSEEKLIDIIGKDMDYSILLDAIEMLDYYVKIGDDKK